MIGEDVDLDLLSLFPQKGARIMEGLRDRASFSRLTMEERERAREATRFWGRRRLFIALHKN